MESSTNIKSNKFSSFIMFSPRYHFPAVWFVWVFLLIKKTAQVQAILIID